MEFVCISRCFYSDRFFDIGYKVDVDDVIECPKCEGLADKSVCRECHGTGRVDPPHHFVSIEEEGKLAKYRQFDRRTGRVSYKMPVEKKETPKDKISILRDKITELGGTYDARWKEARLNQYLLNLKKDKPKVEV